MMLGTCDVRDGKIITSKTTYVVTSDTRPDVRRILFAPGVMIASGLSLMGLGFADILYAQELTMIMFAIAVCLLGGFQVARLTILDRVTRGTQQMSAIYGFHATLQNVRSQINAEIDAVKANESNFVTSSVRERGDAP